MLRGFYGIWYIFYTYRANPPTTHSKPTTPRVAPGKPYKKRMRRAMVLSRAAAMSGERTMMVKRKGSTTWLEWL